jgi:hypothetical protein
MVHLVYLAADDPEVASTVQMLPDVFYRGVQICTVPLFSNRSQGKKMGAILVVPCLSI